jgi:hypothetical protein
MRHGFHEMAERSYIEMIPEAEYLNPGAAMDIMERDEQRCFSGSITVEDLEQVMGSSGRGYGVSE